MRCNDCREKFTDLYEGALSSAEERSLRDHMRSCVKCRDDYAAFCVSVRELHALPVINPPNRFLKKLNDAIDATPPPKSTTLHRLLRMGPVLAAAACFALVLTGVVTLNKYRTGDAFDLQPPEIVAEHTPVSNEVPDTSIASEPDVAKADSRVNEAKNAVDTSQMVPPAPGIAEQPRSPRQQDTTAPSVAPEIHPVPSAGDRMSDAIAADSEQVEMQSSSVEIVNEMPMADEPMSMDRGIDAPAPRPMSAGSRSIFSDTPAEMRTSKSAFEANAMTRSNSNAYQPDTLLLSTQPNEQGCMLRAIPAVLGLSPEAERLYVSFSPPKVRLVGQPVTCSLDITSDEALRDVGVRLETRDELVLVGKDDDYIYQGDLGASQTETIEFRIMANQSGTQRMRASVETPVQGLRGQMEIILPGFEIQPPTPAPDPLGKPINVSFHETPVRQALMQIARDGGLSLIIEASVGGERTRYSAIDTPAGSVLRIIAEAHGYQVEFIDGTYYVCAKD